MPLRSIVEIDQDRCDGCGRCVPSCAEGAIEIREGKAVLKDQAFCDGLGACLGHCPRGAITIRTKEAPEFVGPAPGHQFPDMPMCPGLAVCSVGAGDGLRNWPVKLRLINPQAGPFEGADLLVAADCTAYAASGFGQWLARGKVVLIACPKLDDTTGYVQKLARVLARCNTVTVAVMEVPCCSGLVRLIREAAVVAGGRVRAEVVVIATDGTILGHGAQCK